MKILTTILASVLYCQIAFGQSRILSADSDTVFWFKYNKTVFKSAGLVETKNIEAESFFRFWDGLKAVEIKKTQGKLFGSVTFILQQFKKNKEGRLYIKRMQLTANTSENIQNLIHKYGLIELPTDKMIKGWDQGLDGITYFTEYADTTIYSFKNYWTPSNYMDLPEARQLLDFITDLDKVKELMDKKQEFMKHQPFKSWFSEIGSGFIVIKD